MPDPSPEPDPEPAFEGGFRLRQNALRGFGVGGIVAAAVFAFFVVLPGTRPAGRYVGLAIVLGVSVGLLVTIALVGWRVRRLAEEL